MAKVKLCTRFSCPDGAAYHRGMCQDKMISERVTVRALTLLAHKTPKREQASYYKRLNVKAGDQLLIGHATARYIDLL